MDELSIDRYLNHEMSAEELRNFELQMQNDPALKDEVEKYKKIVSAIQKYPSYKLKMILRQKEHMLNKNENAFNLARIKLSFIIGLVLILCILLTFLLKNKFIKNPPISPQIQDTLKQKNPNIALTDSLENMMNTNISKRLSSNPKSDISTDQLFADNFEAFKDEFLLTETRGDDRKTNYELFCESYLKKDFKQALQYFEQLDEVLKNNDNIAFYQANAFLAIKKADLALPIFLRIVNHGDSRYSAEAYWYIALSYLKNGDIAMSKKYLKSKILSKSFKSQALLSEL